MEIDVEPKPTDLLIEVSVCGLCNWELNHWNGNIGNCPQSLGHEWAGKVVMVGEHTNGFDIGDKVTGISDTMTGFSEYTIVDYKKVIKLAPGTDDRLALGEPLKCVITVLKAAAPKVGDYGVIVGCGAMGLWCIQALRGSILSGLIAIDANDERLKLAGLYGATHTINPKTEPVDSYLYDITKGHMADFVIEGTGNPEVLGACVPYLKANARGRLVLMSSHEGPCRFFDFREAIARSIEILVAHPGYSMDQMDDFRRAVNFLNAGTFDLSKIITHSFTLDEIQSAFETLEKKPSGYIKGVVYPH